MAYKEDSRRDDLSKTDFLDIVISELNKLTGNLTDYDDGNLEEVGEYLTDPEHEPDAILAQAFGADYDEDSYNERLAQTAIDAREHYEEEIPIFAQAEVAKLLEEKGKENVYSVGEVYDEEEDSAAVSKYTTKEIMDEHHENMEGLDLDKDSVLFVSHPAHTQRVMAVAEKTGFEGEPFLPKEVEWPDDSKQWWVESPMKWVPRELVARVHHKVTGQI